tara:strand:- start:371 stop:487 length:117 start_codon:yes stop_codon:yes gene_type:complete
MQRLSKDKYVANSLKTPVNIVKVKSRSKNLGTAFYFFE